jgi:hypothetical protein
MARASASTLVIAAVVFATTQPVRITVMASEHFSTSSNLWLMKRTVRPSALSLRISLRISSICKGARTAVGSSGIRTSAPR